MSVVEIEECSEDVLIALNELMPQLSSGFDALTPSDLEAIVSSELSHLFMATNGRSYIGSVTLVIFRIPSGLRAWVEDVVVAENARGQGVGEQLVQHVLQVAQKANVKSIDLTARSSRQSAISLYKKVGFVDRETNVFRHLPENTGVSQV